MKAARNNIASESTGASWRQRLSRLILASPLLLLCITFFSGIVVWGGFNTAIEATNTQKFCISCHEMRDNVYREFQQSKHFKNSTGVRASCPDCHVPREWAAKVLRKIAATNELYHHFAGSINTLEKFTAKRHQLAQSVWQAMRKNDSQECRNCHSESAMDFSDQRQVAADNHRLGASRGQTCIDCHKGIAHRLPEAYLEAEHLRFERDGTSCHTCHSGMAKPPDEEW